MARTGLEGGTGLVSAGKRELLYFLADMLFLTFYVTALVRQTPAGGVLWGFRCVHKELAAALTAFLPSFFPHVFFGTFSEKGSLALAPHPHLQKRCRLNTSRVPKPSLPPAEPCCGKNKSQRDVGC